MRESIINYYEQKFLFLRIILVCTLRAVDFFARAGKSKRFRLDGSTVTPSKVCIFDPLRHLKTRREGSHLKNELKRRRTGTPEEQVDMNKALNE